MDWQPIETAPIEPFNKEKWFLSHSPYLLLWTGHNVVIGHYGFTERGKGRWIGPYRNLDEVTHWMPLPEPPK